MPDSSFSHAPTHSDGEIVQALQNAVRDVYEKGNLEELTVKRIRKAVEVALGLQDGFFANDIKWKDKSKRIVVSEVEIHDNAAQDGVSSQLSPAAKRSTTRAPITKPASRFEASSEIKCEATTNATTKKRQKKGDAGTAPKPRKKRRSIEAVEQSSDAEGTKPSPNPREKSANSNDQSLLEKNPLRSAIQSKTTESTSSDLSEPISNHGNNQSKEGSRKEKVHDEAAIESESEMSVVLDEAPKAKAPSKPSVSLKAKPSKSQRKGIERPADPDAEEMRRLQGWLIKCGIRKLWGKELAPYPNTKSKIRHLKEMLAEVGMTGRYSSDKATSIREERELKSELEAVQAGEKQWGKGDSEVEADGQPRRRLARGLRELDFLGDDGGEETD